VTLRQPGIPGRNHYCSRLPVGHASGAVDVLMLNTDWLPNLIGQRRLLPLDGYLGSAPPDGWPDA